MGMYNILYLNIEKVQQQKVQKNGAKCAYEYRCIQCSVRAQMTMCECLDYYVFYFEYVKSGYRQILLLLHSLHIGLSQRTVFK